ncbi:PREDICTED: BTB/POZ and MATH domain-containing protein 6-like [Lupinus angustifolius]|uniref:BTB/POZ and MATH domain-containing protein 6-like n=1 Tax=Lupinus angustifolius TaxID=3871 RepID=UPI00092F03CE|nr:PREDICTED: BTB/POZ and MATH domain-containing protein 6-like [Lupinus angustifolius]
MEKKGRKAPPSHYSVKIQSFSLFSKNSLGKYESEEFEAADYKWNLIIYPNGNENADGQDHVSIYLVLRDQSSLPAGEDVNAIVNFYVYNFLEDEYITTQDSSVRRFNVLKSDWGVSKFLDHATLNDPSKGYLIDDTCVFGVDVFVLNTKIKGECITMLEVPRVVSHSWKFDKFSGADLISYCSQPFFAGNYKWKIKFYPNGCGESHGTAISLFLNLDLSSLSTSSNHKVLAKFTLRVKDSKNGKLYQRPEGLSHWYAFSNSCCAWGFSHFLPLARFKDPSVGFLGNDSCILEADVEVLGVVAPLRK